MSKLVRQPAADTRPHDQIGGDPVGERGNNPGGRRGRPLRWWWAAIFLLVGGLSVGVGAATYRIQTDQGEVVIETADEDVEVLVKQGGKVVTVFDPKTQQKLVLHSGTYEFELNGKPTGLKLDIDKATIKRGDVVVAKVDRSPAAAAVTPEAKSPFADAPTKPGVVQTLNLKRVISNGQIAPDGRTFLVATWAEPRGVFVHETTSGKLIHTLPGWIGCYALNGTKVVTENDAELHLFDLVSGKRDRSFGAFKGRVHGLMPIGDGGKQLLAWDETKHLRLFDVPTGKELLVKKFGADLDFTYTPDGKHLVTRNPDEKEYTVYETATGQPVKGFEALCKIPSPGPFSRSGETVLDYDGKHHIRRVSDGRVLGEPRANPTGWIGLGYTTDSSINVGYFLDGTVLLRDAVTGEEVVSQMAKHSGDPKQLVFLNRLAVTSDSRFVLLISNDGHVSIVRMPDVRPLPAKAVDLRGPDSKAGEKFRTEFRMTVADADATYVVQNETVRGKTTITVEGVDEEEYLAVDKGRVTKTRLKVVSDKVTDKATIDGETDTQSFTSPLVGETIEFEKEGDGWKKSLVGKQPTAEQAAELKAFPPPEPFDHFFPAQPVSPGHSWAVDGSEFLKRVGKSMGIEEATGTWKLTFVRLLSVNGKECVEVAEELDLRAKRKTEKGQPESGELKIKGKFIWNPAEGVFVSSECQGTVVLDQTLTADGKPVTMKVTGPVRIEMKSERK